MLEHSRRPWIVLAVMILLAGAVPWFASVGDAQVSTTSSNNAKDVEELKKLFGPLNVVVYLNNQPTVLRGRITGAQDLFGRKFLILVSPEGKNVIVSTEAIAGIKQE